MASHHHLDAHEKPPDEMKDVFKRYQRMSLSDISRDEDILDFTRGITAQQKSHISIKRSIPPEELHPVFKMFCHRPPSQPLNLPSHDIPLYEHDDMPGLHIIPNLLPSDIQLALLSRLIHRDLSNPLHQTNIHKFHNILYPEVSHNDSFFSYPLNSPIFSALDPSTHKPMTPETFLQRKLRWVTLGGQYDWTAKSYPSEKPPDFPADIKALLEGIFPDTKAEAAICNFYSPGDRLSLHRDVAEECARPLTSISIGCEAVFFCGIVDEAGRCKTLAIRLRSGDAVVMSGASRFAWHGVPLVLKGTCPEALASFPAADGEYEQWRGWMAGKRVNLNVRQMVE